MSFKQLIDATMKHGNAVLAEKSPPGFKGTVKAMKDHNEIDNPYALSWWMKNKGYQSHKKASGASKESIFVNHPLHGNGTVVAITESHIEITWDRLDKRITAPATIQFADAKYLTRLREEYTDDVEDAQIGNAKKNLKRVKKGKANDMKKKQKVDESMIAIGMAAIGGTHRGGTASAVPMFDDIVRFEDLLEDGDEWKQPWNEDEGEDDNDTDNSAEGGEGSENRKPDQNTVDGADYTNVPRPADSVLTNQDDQPSYSADPLSTKAGFDSAGDGSEPDGDYQDINPVDAPETPQVRDLEGSSDRGNTRDTGGDSDDTSEVSDAGDYDESKPEDNNGGENKMKNESAWLNASDLGMITENFDAQSQYDDYDNEMNEHEMGSGEVAFTKEFLGKLIAAISAQAPDQATMDALCAGLESAQAEKGDAGLDVSDWDAVTSAASAAYGGGGDDMGGDEMGGDEMGGDDMGDYDDEAGDPVGDGGEEEFGDEESDYEDKAVGDGEVAGAEGGDEHEGKTQMMDCEGDDMYEKKVDVDGKVRGQRPNKNQNQSMKRRAPKKSQQLENKGSGTPVGTGNTSGSGGGNQTDLSKPKSYKGKPVGTGTSGAGGSNSNEFGQKPTKDGGSNNLPEYESGNQLGADNTTFNSDAQSPAPQNNSKPLAAESRKNSRKKIDEAICLGMSSIPGVIRGGHDNVPEDADWDDELKTIKRLAGMENWWR
jgi:hypothetical protein